MSTIQNKKCGKCEKIVYPAEEIKCLDKVSRFLLRSSHSRLNLLNDLHPSIAANTSIVIELTVAYGVLLSEPLLAKPLFPSSV